MARWCGGVLVCACAHRSERTAGECGGEDDEVSVCFLGEEHGNEHAKGGTAGGARDEGGLLLFSHVSTQGVRRFEAMRSVTRDTVSKQQERRTIRTFEHSERLRTTTRNSYQRTLVQPIVS